MSAFFVVTAQKFAIVLLYLCVMDSSGFRRTALSLMVVITITVVAFGIYLYFNFTSRSSLPVIVPANVEEFTHFQTRKFRDDFAAAKPTSFIDSISNLIGSWPIFDHCQKPSEPGIALFSDVVYFKVKDLSFLALTLNSEESFSAFCDTLKKNKLITKTMDLGTYNLVKVIGSPLHFAFKHKVLVLINPKDSVMPDEQLKLSLKEVFSGRSDGFIKKAGLQSLYEADAHFISYNSKLSPDIMGYHFDPKGNHQELSVSLESGAKAKNIKFNENSAFASVLGSLGVSNPQTKDNLIESIFQGVFYTLKTQKITN